ncbi:MAG: hypothetical protein QM654_16480, partial [Dysgonamonadaceae bacterium]
MKKIVFGEINNLIVRHKHEKHYDRDLELLKKHLPENSYLQIVSNVNKFNKSRLDGMILKELLSVLTIEEIKQFRESEQDLDNNTGLETVEEIKSLLSAEFGLDETDFERLEQIIVLLISKSAEEIISTISKLIGDNVFKVTAPETVKKEPVAEESASIVDQETVKQESNSEELATVTAPET